jgi:hypothetical protein
VDLGFMRDADIGSVHGGDSNAGHIHPWTIFRIVWIGPDSTSRVAPGGDRRLQLGRTAEGVRIPN